MKFNKHIVFVTPGFARDEADDLCTPYLQSYFQALKTARPDVRISIIAMQYPFRSGHYKWHEIDVWALGGRNRRWMKPFIWSSLQRQLGKVHAMQPIDLIHGFWLGEAVEGALRFGKSAHLHVFATLMGQDVVPENRYLKRLDLAAIKVIALSKFSDALYAQSTSRHADAIIPFGLDPADCDLAASADRPIDVLGVGSLIAAKRPDRFLRVVSMLRERIPELRAVLVGDGPDRQQLQAMIAELNLGNNVQLVPTMTRVAVLATMSQAKVFLHTSSIEGMGMVLAEALARGCHLVSTPVGVAEQGGKCMLSAHTFGLATHAEHFLKYPVDYAPRSQFPIATMVAAHLKMYGLDA